MCLSYEIDFKIDSSIIHGIYFYVKDNGLKRTKIIKLKTRVKWYMTRPSGLKFDY